MDLQAKIRDCEQRFDQTKAQRDSLIEQANGLLEELNKLQGEYRLLQQMLSEQKPNKSNKKVAAIEAIPEKVGG